MKHSILLGCFLICFSTVFGQLRTDSVHVAHYDLTFSITDFSSRVIDGQTVLYAVSKVNGLSQVRLDLMALTCDSVHVNGTPAAFTHVGQSLLVTVPTMQSGDTAAIRVFYHGVPQHDGSFGGFYFSGQYAYSVGVALHDQPHAYGRCWFPCMDEFTDKSTYSFHIRTENGKMAICNGLLTDSLTLSDSTKVWSWHLDQPVPTYLVNVAVGDYRCYADTFQGMERVIPIEIYAAPALYPNIPASFVHLKPVLRKYEELFGPYRWQRVGYVCVDMTGGAMEHATNIALPNAAVNGTLNYEGTIMHELFHHWFGNLITCERPEEMWINEGFADYSEALIQEWLYNTDTHDAYAEHINDLHATTLQNLARTDGGLYALDNVPQDYTYGMHSYQKGGLVIHTLRNYMGDSLFFSSLRQLLDHFAFQNVNSEQFFTYLTQISGMNLMDFYEDWIHQPGFLDFDVDEIQSHGCGIYSVTVRQKGYGTHHLGTNVPVDVTLVSDNMEMSTTESQFVTDEFTDLMVYSEFYPAFAILDYHGKLADATIDDTRKVAATGSITFTNTSCSAQISQIDDTTLFRVEHHLVAPTAPSPLPDGFHKFSQTHYWAIHYTGGTPEGSCRFRLIRGNGQLDYDLFDNGESFDNLRLMYRPNGTGTWMPVSYTRTGSPYNAYITTELLPGQYCFATADEGVSLTSPVFVRLNLYPNPASSSITLRTDASQADKAVIYDSVGHRVKSAKISNDTQEIHIGGLPAGHYVVVLYQKGKSVARAMFVKA